MILSACSVFVALSSLTLSPPLLLSLVAVYSQDSCIKHTIVIEINVSPP